MHNLVIYSNPPKRIQSLKFYVTLCVERAGRQVHSIAVRLSKRKDPVVKKTTELMGQKILKCTVVAKSRVVLITLAYRCLQVSLTHCVL